MRKRIIAAVVVLSLTSLVFAQSPPLFFKEVWTINSAAQAIAPGENVLINANLELKLYGPSATAADPDKRIWISTPPTNVWTGMTTTPFAATVGFADLIPGSGHGAGGYVNVASFEVYGKPVKRHGAVNQSTSLNNTLGR